MSVGSSSLHPLSPLKNSLPISHFNTHSSTRIRNQKSVANSKVVSSLKMDPLGNPIHHHGAGTGHVKHQTGGYGKHVQDTGHVENHTGGYGEHGTGGQHVQGTGHVGHHTGVYGEQGSGGQHVQGTGHVDQHNGGFGEHGTGGQHVHGGGVTPGVLRRSGSSSSSSSEDDGLGGRRKKDKRIKDKIKEKLPGGHKDDQNPQQHYAQGLVPGEQTHGTEKKGIMEKIKEKLPGNH